MTNRNSIDPDKLLVELSPAWLKDMAPSEMELGKRFLQEILSDWAREANSDPEPQPILAILQREFEDLRQGKGPAQRLETLRQVAAERAINRLSVETFALGKQLLERKLDPAEGRKRGQPLLERAQVLGVALQGLKDPEVTRRLHRDLGESLMEALYAVEGKAMSLRLNRYKSAAKKQ